MKLLSAVLWTMALCGASVNADDPLKFDVTAYPPAASASLSTNVQWKAQANDTSLLMDGLVDTASSGVGYDASACQVEQKDVGYVTIDLGVSMELDGVRVYMAGGSKYCNLFLNVWEEEAFDSFDVENESTIEENESTIDIAVATATTESPTSSAPTKAPTKAPTNAPTKAPTKVPTKVPTNPPTNGPKTTPIPTLFPTKHFQDHNRGVGKDSECSVCFDGLPCDQVYLPTPCGSDKPFCMNTINSGADGSLRVERGCADYHECGRKWWEQSSNKKVCKELDKDLDKRPKGITFECSYCCDHGSCNAYAVPFPETLMIYPADGEYQPGGRHRKLANEGTNLYSSGPNHEYADVGPQGLLIPFNQTKKVRFIRFWAGHNSDTTTTRILEIKLLRKASSSPAQQLTASSSGDPHFKLWNGAKFDFHGGCDLVLLKHKAFRNGLGLNIHIRTVINTWWSSIKAAAVQIGAETFEVMGGGSGVLYWVNGEQGGSSWDEHGNMDFTLAGYKVHSHKINDHQHRFRIDLGHYGDAISLETFKSFVRVDVRVKKPEEFKGAVGMLGLYPGGEMVSRDMSAVMNDANAFGNEWQVLSSESMLFHDLGEGVHHPEACVMPSTIQSKGRRLGESARITEEEARVACGKVNEEEFDGCVFDVLATQDKEMAGSY